MSGQLRFRFDYLRGALPENLVYGHQTTLERYCGKKLRIFGRLQHGYPFELEGDYANAGIADAEYPNFYWRKSDADSAIKKYGSGTHLFTGAPYIYLQEDSPRLDFPLPYKFTLDFLPHSHYWHPPGMVPKSGGLVPIPVREIVQSAESISKHEPVFLIYYRDAIPRVTSEIEALGYKWFSLGDGLYNKVAQATFLGTLRYLIRMSTEVIFHCTISAMAYAALENRPIYFSDVRAGDTQDIPWSGYLENIFYEQAQVGLGVKGKLSNKELVDVLEGEKAFFYSLYTRQIEFMKKSARRGLERFGTRPAI